MEAGIIGLPYVGKTTLFNALVAEHAPADSQSGGIKPTIGVVPVPDARLALLHKYVATEKIVPASLKLVDVPGLARGASTGAGLGNKFLASIRNVDAILHVVRCFDDPSVPHVEGAIDPVRDAEAIETELMLSDLEQVEGMMDKAKRSARSGDKEAKVRLELLEAASAGLGEGKSIRTIVQAQAAFHNPEYQKLLKALAMLTSKPVLYVANVGETAAAVAESDPVVRKLAVHAAAAGGMVVAVCAKIEAELGELPEADRAEMLSGLGLKEPALNTLARAAFKLLGLHSFFTAGPKEIKAWTIPIGATAPQAAGTIHSDFERGFIRAEVYSVADLDHYKTEAAIKAAGKLRVEGKSYVMRDSDVCHFLFNV
jgi:ribosome-binding ATPase